MTKTIFWTSKSTVNVIYKATKKEDVKKHMDLVCEKGKYPGNHCKLTVNEVKVIRKLY